MNPSAEDGGGPPTALAPNHRLDQNHEEQPGAVSDPPARAPVDDPPARAPVDDPPVRPPVDSPPVRPPVDDPPVRPPVDGFAVASLITGILALIPLAVTFGPIALSRIARTGARGRSLAITGLALGGTWAVAAAIAVAVIISHRPPAAAAVFPKVFSLRTGECINSAPNGISGLRVLACGQPHDGEVFSTFRLAGQQYPGAAALRQKANQGCQSRLSGYMNPQLSAMLDEAYFYPSSGAWAAGERTAVCTVRSTGGQLTGSVRTAPVSG